MVYKQIMLRTLLSLALLSSAFAAAETFEQYQKLYGIARHHELQDLEKNPSNAALATKLRGVVTKLRSATSEEVRGEQNRERLQKNADELENALNRIVLPSMPAAPAQPAQQPVRQPVAPMPAPAQPAQQPVPGLPMPTMPARAQPVPALPMAPEGGITERGIAQEPGTRTR